jgi:hypothetical protein
MLHDHEEHHRRRWTCFWVFIARSELSLVRDWEEFIAVVDVIRQTVQVVIAELGMIIDLARLLAEKSLMFLPAAGADDSKASRMSFKLTRMVILSGER